MNTVPAMKSASATRKEARLFTCLAVVSGAMFLGALLTLPYVHRRSGSTHWPTTNGVITAAGLKLYLHKRLGIEPSYRPQISYSYVADGIPRVGNQISFAYSFPTFHKDEGSAWLNHNYPIGKTVTVHYDPADPDFSVLEPGAEDLILNWCWMTGSLAFCFLLALWMRSRAIRIRREIPSPL